MCVCVCVCVPVLILRTHSPSLVNSHGYINYSIKMNIRRSFTRT